MAVTQHYGTMGKWSLVSDRHRKPRPTSCRQHIETARMAGQAARVWAQVLLMLLAAVSIMLALLVFYASPSTEGGGGADDLEQRSLPRAQPQAITLQIDGFRISLEVR